MGGESVRRADLENGTSDLIKTARDSSLPLPPSGVTDQDSLGSRLSPDTEFAGTSMLDFQPLKLEK